MNATTKKVRSASAFGPVAVAKTPLERMREALELGRRGRLLQKLGRNVREAGRPRAR